MEPYINTELLSIKYRLLGATIGSRVNIDYFQLVEYDLLTVEANTPLYCHPQQYNPRPQR